MDFGDLGVIDWGEFIGEVKGDKRLKGELSDEEMLDERSMARAIIEFNDEKAEMDELIDSGDEVAASSKDAKEILLRVNLLCDVHAIKDACL
jgi:hypothetical protein